MIRTQNPLLWLPPLKQREPLPAPTIWRRGIRWTLLSLMATILIICHPCHGEDIDDELRFRGTEITSQK